MSNCQINSIPYEKLRELAEDIYHDGGRHNGLVFNNWMSRNDVHGIQIKDVSPLFCLSCDNADTDAVLQHFLSE